MDAMLFMMLHVRVTIADIGVIKYSIIEDPWRYNNFCGAEKDKDGSTKFNFVDESVLVLTGTGAYVGVKSNAAIQN